MKNLYVLSTLVILSCIIIFGFIGCPAASSDGGEGGGDGDGITIIDGTWSTTIDTLSSVDTNSEPKVTFYTAKKAMAVWSSDDNPIANVYSKHFNGTDWVEELQRATYSHGSGFFKTSPHIASNFNGVSFTAWRGGADYANSMWTARIDNASWGATSVRKDDGGDSQKDDPPHIACTYGSTAGAFLVWLDLTDGDVFAATYSDTAWQTGPDYENISNSEFNIINPKVAADLAGNAMAVMDGDDPDDYNIYAIRYSGSSREGGATDISTIVDNGDNPQVAFDINGDAVVVWKGSDNHAYANRFLAGSTWPTWEGDVAISPSGASGVSKPQLASDPRGNIFFVWEEDGAIKARRYPAGTDWSTWAAAADTDTTILDPGGGCIYPWITVDENGRAIVVWERSGQIYSKRYFD